MIHKFTHTENRQMVEILTLQAIELGLLDADSRLVYTKGNTSYGHSTEIHVEKFNEDGHRIRQPRPMWLPEFGYKDGPSFVGNAIYAVQNALYGMIGIKQEAARAALREKAEEEQGTCPRCGGKWGADPTCPNCTDADGNPRKADEAPDNATKNYRRYELSKVDATGEYPAKVKFFSDAGESKHLNITSTEFEQIKNVLLDYRND